MCSIIGYKGQLNAAPLLVDSLKQMEYRGYDSVGIAIINDGKVIALHARWDDIVRILNAAGGAIQSR